MAVSSNTRGIARIVKLTADGLAEKHVGMAFIVGRQQVMTCCHVLNDALDRKDRLDPQRPPADKPFLIRFPYADDEKGLGVVDQWGLELSPSKDVAVLKLNHDAPEAAGLAGFSDDEVQRERWSCIGRDENNKEREVQGELGTLLSTEQRQLNGPPGGVVARVAGGYSGSPVWCDTPKAFVGMVVTNDRDFIENGVSFAIPTGVLAEVWPDLPRMRDGRLIDRSLADPQAVLKAYIIDDDLVVLDRTTLTQQLVRLRAKAAQKRVVLVRGGPRSGKTHCRYLFELVAQEEDAKPVYLDRDLMPTVDATVSQLFGALNASDKVPRREEKDSTDSAWYTTICNRLRDLSASKQATLWLAIDDLGLDPKGRPFIDSAVLEFFNQFVLLMKNPHFREPFRLLLIHYPDGNLPSRWDRNVVLQETTNEMDVRQEHIVELLRLWLKNKRVNMTEAAIDKRAAEILAKAEEPVPPGQERGARLERIHEELVKALQDLKGPPA
jgi:hypothetical protein